MSLSPVLQCGMILKGHPHSQVPGGICFCPYLPRLFHAPASVVLRTLLSKPCACYSHRGIRFQGTQSKTVLAGFWINRGDKTCDYADELGLICMPCYRTRVGSASPKAHRLRQGRWGLEQNFELVIKKGRIILGRKWYRFFDPSREPEAVYVKKSHDVFTLETNWNVFKCREEPTRHGPILAHISAVHNLSQKEHRCSL